MKRERERGEMRKRKCERKKLSGKSSAESEKRKYKRDM